MLNTGSSDDIILLVPIDPRLRANLNLTYKKMHEYRINKKEAVFSDIDSRRCNKCGKYFPKNETILRKYYAHSTRKYRLCNNCSDHTDSNS